MIRLFRQTEKQRRGRKGERLARGFLRRHGLRVIQSNVLVPMGEADIICQDTDDTFVVVEVKTRRRSPADPPPEMSVDRRKQRTLRNIGKHLARANEWGSWRIDVVAVDLHDDRKPEVRHHRGAVSIG